MTWLRRPLSNHERRFRVPRQAEAALGKIQVARNVEKGWEQCPVGYFIRIDELRNGVNLDVRSLRGGAFTVCQRGIGSA